MTRKISQRASSQLIEQAFQGGIQAQQQQDWQRAEQAYLQVLELDREHLPSFINLGAVYRHLKQGEKAKQCYQSAIKRNAQSLEAWFNLGNIHMAEGNVREAEQAYQQVRVISRTTGASALPHAMRALAQLGSLARQQGNWQLTIEYLNQVLKLQQEHKLPENPDMHLELGNALRHLGQNKEALKHYQDAVKLAPQSWKMHYSLARLADQLGQSALFKSHYDQALQLTEEPYSLHLALAQTRFDNGDIAGTIEQYRLALQFQADSFTARLGLASALMAAGQVADAQQLYHQLSQTDNVHALSQLAREIWTHKFFAESVAILKRMVELRPDLYDTHLNLAKAYSQTWEFSKALPCIEQSLAINPDCVEAKDLLADIYLRQGRCDESAEIYADKLQRDGFRASHAASLLFCLLYSQTQSAEYKAQRHQELMQELVSRDSTAICFKSRKRQSQKLRIGYVSGDYRDQHPVGLFITPVLKYHNREQFVLYAYYNNRTYDSSTEEIKALTDQWYEVSSWTDERLQQQILADEIDILVDLSGQTGKNRLGVFALRAAPIQVTWLGYPHSTGLKQMDYLLADPITCPQQNDHLCSEEVYRLEEHCVFCYPPFERYPDFDRTIHAENKIVFGSFNNLTKVNKYTLKLWVKLLKAIPNAILYLKTPSFTDPVCIEQFYSDFASQGIPRERLNLVGPCGLDDMMKEYLRIDIGLDPIPYNGGTTTMQALWMGVPVITLAGDNFCGRMGASIMHFAGLSDWVAHSEADYIRIAVEKAADYQQLERLKRGLREQLRQSPLFDNPGFTQDLERAYLKFWQAWEARIDTE